MKKLKKKYKKLDISQFVEWGRQGGIATRNKLSPERRKEIATKASHARYTAKNKGENDVEKLSPTSLK